MQCLVGFWSSILSFLCSVYLDSGAQSLIFCAVLSEILIGKSLVFCAVFSEIRVAQSLVFCAVFCEILELNL